MPPDVESLDSTGLRRRRRRYDSSDARDSVDSGGSGDSADSDDSPTLRLSATLRLLFPKLLRDHHLRRLNHRQRFVAAPEPQRLDRIPRDDRGKRLVADAE